LTRLSLRSRF
jgi:hypothetical protein